MTRRAKGVLSAVLIAAVLVAVAIWTMCGGDSPAHTSTEGEATDASARAYHQARSLTRHELRRLEAAALRDRRVRQLTAGRAPSVERVLPWTNAEGTQLLGAGVYIEFRSPRSLEAVPLPAYLTPNEAAPPGAPNLRRRTVYSATGVSRLKVRTLLRSAEVVEIEPMGGHIHITKARLLGPTPSNAYKVEGD